MIAGVYARMSTDLLTRGLVLAMVMVLGGCASSRATSGLHEGEAHAITCSGPDRTWALCGERAAQICGARSYDVIAASGGTAAMIETLNPAAGVGGPINERSILIRCR